MKEKRKELLDCLEKAFGSYQLIGHVYQFDHFEQKHIASVIGADPSNLNRLLNVTEHKKSQTFDRYIVLATNYYKAKQYDEAAMPTADQHPGGRKKASFVALLLLTAAAMLVALFYARDRSRLFSETKIYKSQLYTSRETFPRIFKLISAYNAPKLAQLAVLQNIKVKNSSSVDTLEIMRECMDQVRSTVIYSRQNTLSNSIIAPNGNRLSSWLTSLYATTDLYACSDSIISFAPVAPAYATPFDRALMDLRKVIFDKDIGLEELIRLVEREVVSVQDEQISSLLKKVGGNS